MGAKMMKIVAILLMLTLLGTAGVLVGNLAARLTAGDLELR